MINYFDCGLCYGREFKFIIDIIFPDLNIIEYKAYGFEPCKSCFDDLKKQHAGNQNVTLINSAIFNEAGKNKLYHSYKRRRYTPIGNSLFKTHNMVREEEYEEVDCIVFSDWVKNNVPTFRNDFNIIRMNMEGGEWCLFNDLKNNDMLKQFDIYCGTDVEGELSRIEELKQYIPDILELFKENNIIVHYFIDKPDIENLTNLIRENYE